MKKQKRQDQDMTQEHFFRSMIDHLSNDSANVNLWKRIRSALPADYTIPDPDIFTAIANTCSRNDSKL